MITDELLDFLRAQLEEGVSEAELRTMLLGEGGWSNEDVTEGFRALAAKSLPSTETPKKIEETPAATFETLAPEVSETPHPDDFLGIFGDPVSTPAPIENKIVSNESDVITIEPPVDDVHATIADMPPQGKTPILPKVESETLGAVQYEEKDTAALSRESLINDVQTQPRNTGMPTGGEIGSLQYTATRVYTPSERPDVAATTQENEIENEELRQVVIAPGAEELPPQEVAGSIAAMHRDEAPKFNISAMRAGAMELEKPKTGPTTKTVMPQLAKVEARTMSDVWLEGGKAVGATPPEESKHEEAAPPIVNGKRTMASDLLLRGMSTKTGGAGIPSLNTPVSAPFPGSKAKPTVKEEKKEPVKPERETIMPLGGAAVAQPVWKKTLKVLFILFLVTALVGGGVFAYLKLRAPDATLTVGNSFSKFLALSSFSYSGKASVNITLKSLRATGGEDGSVKFDADYDGSIMSGSSGYGDGKHRIKVAGGLQSGSFKWPTDVNVDVRVIGKSIYFYFFQFPESASIDKDLLKTYWLKVDQSELSDLLLVSSGNNTKSDDYGNFGGSIDTVSFPALLTTHTPFTPGSLIASSASPEEKGVVHYGLKTDPERMIAFISALYNAKMGKTLTMTDDERVRFSNALEKVTGEIWVEEASGNLKAITINATFDDDILGFHVKGPFAVNFAFSKFNEPVVTDAPSPTLDLAELKVRMNEYKEIRVRRDEDTKKILGLRVIETALANFGQSFSKYPTQLSELRQRGILSTSTISDQRLAQYYYASYISKGNVSKTERCTNKTIACSFFHLGVNLDDMDNPELLNDSDYPSDVRGADTSGCAGENNVSCFDVVAKEGVVAPPPAKTTTTSKKK